MMYDLILKKRNGEILTKEEISYMIENYTNGTIPDYQMAAMAMAIYFQGMNDQETLDLTLAMAHSGEMLDLSAIHGKVVDKHSTGGVGDKITLILGPMTAACGLPVAKMSGRGLGFTGGTIDKLESIPGFSTTIPTEQFMKNINEMKLSVVGQTKNLAPADKKIYALRDVTGTVESIPLIASSIMSKKLASGAECIVLDVKTGNGAFMKSMEDAKKLAKEMVKIGNGAGRKTVALITDMNEPLGNYVGNALEVEEAIDVLSGKGSSDLLEVSVALGKQMLFIAGNCNSLEEAEAKLRKTIADGSALKKFAELIERQGGDTNVITNRSLFPQASITKEIYAKEEGYVSSMETDLVGKTSLLLGGGRLVKDSPVDLAVGIVLQKKTGDFVKKGDVLAVLYANDQQKLQNAEQCFKEVYHFSEKKPEEKVLVKCCITMESL